MNFEELKLKNQICHRIYSVNNGIQRLYRPILSELGLTYVQYVILMALWEKDHVSMGELASLTKLDKGFLTTTIEKMKQDSLVKLVADKLDQRKKIVLLTKKGISLKHRARCIPSEVLNLLYSNDIKISKKDIETFINVLDKMNLLISESQIKK